MSKAHSGITLWTLTANNSSSLSVLRSNVHSVKLSLTHCFENNVSVHLFPLIISQGRWDLFCSSYRMKQIAHIKPSQLTLKRGVHSCISLYCDVMFEGALGKAAWLGYDKIMALLETLRGWLLCICLYIIWEIKEM